MEKKTQVSLYIKPSVLEKIRNDAAKNLRSISGQIEYILHEQEKNK